MFVHEGSPRSILGRRYGIPRGRLVEYFDERSVQVIHLKQLAPSPHESSLQGAMNVSLDHFRSPVLHRARGQHRHDLGMNDAAAVTYFEGLTWFEIEEVESFGDLATRRRRPRSQAPPTAASVI